MRSEDSEGATVEFVKLVAAGNDFVMFDGDRWEPPDLPAFARWACRRETGLGADGVLLARCERAGDILLTVANPDGSIAKMCGNGARCAAFHLMGEYGRSSLTIRFLGRDRPHILQAHLVEGGVELTSPRAGEVTGPIRIGGLDYHSLDTGTEYAVAFVPDLDAVDVPALGRAIRHHPQFGTEGTSVSFAEHAPRGLRVRTYERGNEAETLSCGSGAVACAVVARHLGLTREELVRVDNRSGSPLTVRMVGAAPPFAGLTLTGPAQEVFRGTLVWRAGRAAA